MEIEDVVALHGKVAERIKQFETAFEVYPPTEVLNELRYALRAAIEVLEVSDAGADEQEIAHAIQKTNHALLCAYHDLVDGTVMLIATTLDDLREQYLEESITVLGSKRMEIIEFVAEVNDKIALSRKNQTERGKIYDKELYGKYFDTLIEYRKLLTGPVIEDVVKLHKQNRIEREKKLEELEKNRNRFRIATLIALASATAAFIGLLIG